MNKIPIVFASSNSYIIPTIVAITSMLHSKNSNTFYDIFILDNNISAENKNAFFWKDFKDQYKLTFIKLNLKDFENYKGNTNWSITTFGRYYICDLLPNYDKCIYLDGDTLILNDLFVYKTCINSPIFDFFD